MATYRHDEYILFSDNAAFDTLTGPGRPAPYSGIYRCDGCGQEIAASQEQPLPPQNNHQHSMNQGAIRWRLIVAAQ